MVWHSSTVARRLAAIAFWPWLVSGACDARPVTSEGEGIAGAPTAAEGKPPASEGEAPVVAGDELPAYAALPPPWDWGRDNWEDALLPQCRLVFDGHPPSRAVSWERRPQMTENHEAARLCVALGAALTIPAHRSRGAAVVAEVEAWLAGQREEHMYGEQLSSYWPLWAVPIAGMLAVAHREGERRIEELAREWFYRDAALNRLLATPDGRVVAPGCRTPEAIWDPERDMALAWLTGRPLRPELQQMVERPGWFEKAAGGRPFERWGALLVKTLVDRGLLPPRLDLGRDDLPGLRWSLEVRRFEHGHQAWSPYLECATGPRWAAVVDYRRPQEPLLLGRGRDAHGGPMPVWPREMRGLDLGEPVETVSVRGTER